MKEHELEERIFRLKKELTDYQKIAKKFNFPQDEVEIKIDLMLETLTKLMKRLENLKKK